MESRKTQVAFAARFSNSQYVTWVPFVPKEKSRTGQRSVMGVSRPDLNLCNKKPGGFRLPVRPANSNARMPTAARTESIAGSRSSG